MINLERDLVKLRAALESDRGSERDAIEQVTTTYSMWYVCLISDSYCTDTYMLIFGVVCRRRNDHTGVGR